MMKRIVVLGANGYIARNLVYLLESDHMECELALYGIEENSIDGYNNYCKVDMTDKDEISKINLNCDIVYMFVGRTGTANGFEQYDSFIRTNELALLNLLAEYRRQNSSARIIYPSTRLVYKGQDHPVDEDSEKEFKTIYAINKYACEQYLKQYNLMYGVQYTIFRICVPYGTLVKGATSYGTAEFMLTKAENGENISLYGDGSVRRTLTYMEDLCQLMIKGAFSEKCANDVFNIGGEDLSLKEMAEMIAKRYNVSIDYVEWPETGLKIESGSTVFDSSKLDKIVSIKNRHRFADWCEK